MRLFIFLALFLLPMTIVQFYSTDSYALTDNTVHQDILFNKTVLPGKHASNMATYIDGRQDLTKNSVLQVENEQTKINIAPPKKTKKVRLVAGKKNSHGMQLLSVLLLLKDKSR